MHTSQIAQTERLPAAADLARAVVTARVWNDPGYLDRLLADTRRELTDAGYDPGPGVEVTVLVDTPSCTNVVLPKQGGDIPAGVVTALSTLSPGREVCVVRQSSERRFLTVPLAPEEPAARIDTEFAMASPATAGWSVWTYTSLVEAAVVVTTVLGAAEATAIVLLV